MKYYLQEIRSLLPELADPHVWPLPVIKNKTKYWYTIYNVCYNWSCSFQCLEMTYKALRILIDLYWKLLILTDGTHLAVQLFVQLTDALCQLCQLLCDDSMMNGLSCVGLHIEILFKEISIALWKETDQDL